MGFLHVCSDIYNAVPFTCSLHQEYLTTSDCKFLATSQFRAEPSTKQSLFANGSVRDLQNDGQAEFAFKYAVDEQLRKYLLCWTR